MDVGAEIKNVSNSIDYYSAAMLPHTEIEPFGVINENFRLAVELWDQGFCLACIKRSMRKYNFNLPLILKPATDKQREAVGSI
jgi:hypothetical protein